MIEKEKKMNEMNSLSERKSKKRNMFENFEVPNLKRKETAQSIKTNGNHNYSLLSKSNKSLLFTL
jgi:hypothetical protein